MGRGYEGLWWLPSMLICADLVGDTHIVGTTHVFATAVHDPPLRSPNLVYEAVDRAELCEKGR